MLRRSEKAFLFLSFISHTGLPVGFSTSPVSTNKFCGFSFKRCLGSVHFSPSTGTILAQAAIPSPGSQHQSTLDFHPPIYTPHGSAPIAHHSHVGLLSTGPFTVPQTYQALPAPRPLYLHCLNTIPQDIHLGVPSPPTDLCSNIFS